MINSPKIPEIYFTNKVSTGKINNKKDQSKDNDQYTVSSNSPLICLSDMEKLKKMGKGSRTILSQKNSVEMEYAGITGNKEPLEKYNAKNALMDLFKAEVISGEKTPEIDTVNDFLFIKNLIKNNPELKLKDTTEAFLNLLYFLIPHFKEGECNKMVRNFFEALNDIKRDDESMSEAVNHFKGLISTENMNIFDGCKAYKLLMEEGPENESTLQIRYSFEQLRKWEYGESARESFSLIVKTLRMNEKLFSCVKLYNELHYNEQPYNNPKNIRANYFLIDSYVSKDNTREELTKEFIEILRENKRRSDIARFLFEKARKRNK